LRFWDSSALVPLVVEQSTSARAAGWVEEDGEVVIWTLTPIEIVSALQRLVREGELDERAAISAENLVLALLESAHEIAAVDRVKETARRVLRTHPLRAADALQLAAALVWAEHDTRDAVVHTLDNRLALAALREGFEVVPRPVS
jgi:predicted nucleic acid-binding protein